MKRLSFNTIKERRKYTQVSSEIRDKGVSRLVKSPVMKHIYKNHCIPVSNVSHLCCTKNHSFESKHSPLPLTFLLRVASLRPYPIFFLLIINEIPFKEEMQI